MVGLDGAPLYRPRTCDTFSYDLSPGPDSEQALYDETTAWLRQAYGRARDDRPAVRLALGVFQRRLASSTLAVARSFERRLAKLERTAGDLRTGRVDAAERRRVLAAVEIAPDRITAGAVRFLTHALVVPARASAERERYDARVEEIAVRIAAGWERGAEVRDVSRPALARQAGLPDWPGFDLLSTRPDGAVRSVEVKGRAGRGGVQVETNEWKQGAASAPATGSTWSSTARPPRRGSSGCATRSRSCSPPAARRSRTSSPPRRSGHGSHVRRISRCRDVAAVYDCEEITGMLTPKVAALVSAIRAGEDTELDLKEVVFRGNRISFAAEEGRASSKLAEVFVSMANTRGGAVVLGVRDSDRMVVGVDPRKRDLLEQFTVNVATTNCIPMIVPALDWEFLPAENEEPKLCLIIDVPASRFDVHQTSDGRFLQRIGSHRHLIPAERLARLLSARRMTDPIEERPVFAGALDDLHELRLETYFRGRFPSWSRPDDWTSTLLAHKLAASTDAGVTPTHLGVLLFSERPDRYLPGACIDLAAYRHGVADGNTADSRRITGPLPEQIGQVLTYFWSSPLAPTTSRKERDGRRDFPSYAHTALQEAVVNAVVHRDYEVRGSQIIIRLFPDRIEFQNPGALHNTLTVENVYAGCQPARRNQFLAGFMRDYKSALTGTSYMEARGEGFLNLVRASERLSGRRPELEQIGEATKLTIFAAQHAAP